jgi:hypothetical protein
VRANVLVTGANIVAADENGSAMFAQVNEQIVNMVIQAGTRPLVQMEVTNTGETPAHNAAVYGAAKLVAWPLNENDLRPEKCGLPVTR